MLLGKQFRLPIMEELIKSMCVNEVARFVINKQLLTNYPYISAQYRKFANYPVECKIKSNSSCCARAIEQGVGYDDLNELMTSPKDLIFIFEILKAEHDYRKEFWEQNDDERHRDLLSLKQKGNDLYTKASYTEAEKCYLKALAIVNNLQIKHSPKADEYKELQRLEIALHSNIAQLKFKQNDFYESIQYCNKVLKVDKENVKMYYRRAQCNARVWNQLEAERDYEQVLKLDARMKNTVSKELDEFRVRIKKVEQEESEALSQKLTERLSEQMKNHQI